MRLDLISIAARFSSKSKVRISVEIDKRLGFAWLSASTDPLLFWAWRLFFVRKMISLGYLQPATKGANMEKDNRRRRRQVSYTGLEATD